MKNKNGQEIRVGQIWEDMDSRMGGRQRKIVAIDEDLGKVQMGAARGAGVLTWVSITRLHPHYNGWTLVKDVDGGTPAHDALRERFDQIILDAGMSIAREDLADAPEYHDKRVQKLWIGVRELVDSAVATRG